MESQVLDAIIPHLNSTIFGFETVEDLIHYELTSDDIYTEEDLLNHHRVKRKEVKFLRQIGRCQKMMTKFSKTEWN